MNNNFMIGMFGNFDENKLKRDFKEDFYGVEACLFKSEEDINRLIEVSKSRNFKIGIHFPLRAGMSKFRDMQFMSLDKIVKAEAFRNIEDELIYIKNKGINPEYILFHYPKPVILKDNFDMKNWRFADISEYVYEDKYSFEEFKSSSEYLFKWLSEKSVEYKFIPILEFDALNKYITENDFLEQLLQKYEGIKLCLDTGRLHLQHKIDYGLDEINIIKRFARYAAIVHLWNVRINDNLENSHFPALPKLKEEDGWGDIEKYMTIIFSGNPEIKVMFEHRSELISDDELEQCYSWIKGMK